MVDYRDNVPGYRTIRVGPPGGREAAVADEQAWRARDAYPDLASVGGVGFGMVQELEQGGWQLLRDFMDPYPQDTRPSDPDPQPPVMIQNGGRPHEEPDDDEPVKLSESAQRLQRLFHEEEARLAARRARSSDDPEDKN